MNDQTSPGKNQKSGRVSKKLGHFAKTDVRFWQDRLFREAYRKNGALRETSHWSARIQHAGRRERFPLYTPNKAAAAAKARDLSRSMLALTAVEQDPWISLRILACNLYWVPRQNRNAK